MSTFGQLRDGFGWSADCTPNSELITTDKIRLVGAIFNGGTLDSNFWSNRVSTGTVTQVANTAVLTSGTANGHYAELWTVRRATWVTGTSMKFRSQVRFGDTGTANVVRRWGVGWVSGSASTLITDGACFKLNGTALSIVTHFNSTSGTEVASASFNGTYAAPTFTNSTTYEILYTLGKVYFLIGGVIVHTVIASTAHWTSGTVNFHAFADVNNTGNSSAVTMSLRMMNISRLGSIATQPTYKYITGVNTEQILKLGGGMIHQILIGTCVNGKTISVYDNITGTGSPMAVITLPTNTDPFAVDLDCPFFTGLNVTPNDAGLKITVIYE